MERVPPETAMPADGDALRAVPVNAIPALRRVEAQLKRPRPFGPGKSKHGRWGHTFAAVDLGTNNCRLLIARPHQTGFRVVDAFSRTVRLGEGLTSTGRLAPHAMDRTLEALRICAEKMKRRGVTRARAVATEACRSAENGRDFIDRASRETGLSFEIITTHEEARLAVESCQSLVDRSCDHVLVFDIGGGSTELIVLDLKRPRKVGAPPPIEAWTSLPLGVVSLTERFGHAGSVSGDPSVYGAMLEAVKESLKGFAIPPAVLRSVREGRAHIVGNSGTVTTIAGVLLGLARYDRAKVDGAWIDLDDAARVAREFAAKPWAERAANPCIGPDRADLLMPGAAILEAIRGVWPTRRLRVADRGLREGVLHALMARADRDGRDRRRARRGADPAMTAADDNPPAAD